MIELYSTNVTATADMVVPWNAKSIQTGQSATLNADGQTISLSSAGVYEVQVNGYGTTTAAGTFGFQLNGDGAAITRAATSTTTEAGEIAAAGFSTLVKVNADYVASDVATLTLTYTGSAGTISLVNAIIRRIL